ncbi:N-acetylmuramoyl-L-alanine amidase [Pseudoxanthomonas sacheonensis]|uniref:N-acetylmuramoyl-L-alanine amidase n=1 Tax=Pseudoxanthomonas sacheonensis TaxID=443615 RepID=UPI0013D32B4C|nr:N-acetylmuramoyl-L-alanine amidase [Pseudoxanthomonas sacheonensis]KAF1707323.1 N-acetylmuramoyl-L-alanine amidase [Pseudoxanthomonas sacheonensis]
MHKGITRFGSTTVGIALALGVACPVLAGEVRSVSVDTGATGTRAEIQLEGKGEYRTLSLAGPDRLVVDLPASTAVRGLKLPAGAGIVKSVRTGQPTPDTLRIVFDLSSSVVAMKPRLEPTASGARLVLEWPGDGPASVATVAKATAADSSPATQQAGTPQTPAQQTSTQAAAQATAALTSAAVQQAAAKPPAVLPQLSPQAILNGQSTQAVVPAGTSEPRTGPAPAPTQPAPVQYTIATGVPAPATTAASTPTETASASTEPAYKPMPQVPMRAGMRPLVIAIDAGHGGQDPGAQGPTGKREKDVTLAMARELARQINATPGMKAYLVRDGDYFIPLPQRAQKARANKADMFVSIHADAAENRSARGSSVYVLSLKGASSQRARWLADKENSSDLVGGVRLQQVDNTLSSVLLDLAQSGHMKASEDAASHVLDGLKRVGNNHKPNIERANFAVLRTSDMPAMLVETAFISNADEERRLTDPAYQRKVAGAVLDGVQTYFPRQPPPGTLFAARAAAADAASRTTASIGSAGAP